MIGNLPEFLTKHNIQVGTLSNDVVPLGMGAVFAEVVLRRSNCSEKLDITRFWNWRVSARMILQVPTVVLILFRNLLFLCSLQR